MLTNQPVPYELMTFVYVSQFHVYLPWCQHLFCLNRFLNVKVVVAALSVITDYEPLVTCLATRG